MYRKKNSLCLVRHKVPLECHSGECIFQQEFENTVPVRCYSSCVCVCEQKYAASAAHHCVVQHLLSILIHLVPQFSWRHLHAALNAQTRRRLMTRIETGVCVGVFAHAITNCGMGNVALARFHLLFHMRFVQMSLLQMNEYVTATLSIVVK